MVPPSLRTLINILNEDEVINKSNIKAFYTKLIDLSIFQSNNLNIEALQAKELRLIFNEVNMKNILISSSTYNLLKSFHIFVLFLNYIHSITFDIFLQLFQNVDFYVNFLVKLDTLFHANDSPEITI